MKERGMLFTAPMVRERRVASALAAQRAEIERLQETIRYERDRNLDKVLDARDEVAVLRRALQELLHEIIEPASGHHAPLNDAIASARAALGARK